MSPCVRASRPKQIVLIRHGESYGNVDETAYGRTPDWRIPLTDVGVEQAKEAGRQLKSLISPEGKVVAYVSPYSRTLMTCESALSQLDPQQVVEIRQEPRIREQDFGNLQNMELISHCKEERQQFGRFFYRFPNGGESGADVYDRVSTFLESLQRHFQNYGNPFRKGRSFAMGLVPSPRKSNDAPLKEREEQEEEHDDPNPPPFRPSRPRFYSTESSFHPSVNPKELTVAIFTHGLTLRIFLMRWFRWTVDTFETLQNPPNARKRWEMIVMRRDIDGFYELTASSKAALGLAEEPDDGELCLQGLKELMRERKKNDSGKEQAGEKETAGSKET